MSKHKLEFDEICPSCEGTGLYIGFAENNGAAIVCHTCKGTGCHHVKIEYEDFEQKVSHKTAKRVFQSNPGIGIGSGKGYSLSDFGGMPYNDWINGNPFPNQSEMRKYSCPAWWYQSADYKKKPDWKECEIGGTFSGCASFKNKDKCWKRFDKETTP